MKTAQLAIAQLKKGGSSPVIRSDKSVVVDRANGIIKNVSLMTIGAALGWPFTIDSTTIDQLINAVNSDPSGGVRCRLGHPEMKREIGPTGEMEESVKDDIGRVVGTITNASRDADRARGDVKIGPYAANMPGLGDVRSYLLDMAEHSPEAFGMSAMFPYTTEPQFDAGGSITGNPARLQGLDAIDIVGKPAANPSGLLAARTAAAFDPQPPAPGEQSAKKAGWGDNDPRDFSATPTPANTIEYPHSTGPYMQQMLERGHLSIGHVQEQLSALCKAGLATYCGGVYLPTDKAKLAHLAACKKKVNDASLATEMKFLSFVHDNLPHGGKMDMVKGDGLRVGDNFKIGGINHRIAEDEDGYRVLKQGKDYAVPTDMLPKYLPIDK